MLKRSLLNYSLSLIHSGIAWIEFLNSDDNLGDILSHLREGDMKGAQLLWLRYEVKKRLPNCTSIWEKLK